MFITIDIFSPGHPVTTCRLAQGIGQGLRDVCCAPLRSVQTFTSSARSTDWDEVPAISGENYGNYYG